MNHFQRIGFIKETRSPPQPIVCVSYLRTAVTTAPDVDTLRDEQFLLVHASGCLSPSWWGKHSAYCHWGKWWRLLTAEHQETETELGPLVGSNLPRPAPTATSYKQASPPKDSTVSPARDQAPKTWTCDEHFRYKPWWENTVRLQQICVPRASCKTLLRESKDLNKCRDMLCL